MPRRKEDDVAEALNLLRDANMQSIAGKSELDQLIDTYFARSSTGSDNETDE